jgi:polysaccharide chain length determinant protein (PEP-CTERM system associated)
MQSPYSDSYSATVRRPLDIEDYLDILRRHKAWIVAPMFAAVVLAVVVAFLWPDTYVSAATIRVVPPQVPESYVPTNINVQMSQRVNSMYQTISSRVNLTNMINMYNLYAKDRQRKPMEDVVEQMRKDIRIGNVMSIAKGGNNNNNEISAFQITFQYFDRITAQKVCADLVSKFMTENTRERTTQSIQTTQFLRDQLENAKKELDAIEAKLANFRQTFQGRLPDQIQQNSQQLSMMEQRVTNMNNSLSRVAQEKMLLESDLRTFTAQRAALAPAPDVAVQRQKNEDLIQLDREILKLEGILANLREHYKENYPDVRRVQAQLNTKLKQREKLEKDEEVKQANAAVGTSPRRYDPTYEREGRLLDTNIERLETQTKAKDLEAEEYRKAIQNAEKQIRLLQSRIEASPVSEQQYAEVIRDREVAKAKYEGLNIKRSQSAIAEELERRQQGETLEVLDPASLPQSQTYPPRPTIIGAGAALGLVIGVVLAGVREAKDTSLKNLKDVRAYTQLTILGSVPLLENDLVVRRRKRLTWLAWSTASLVGIMIMTGAVFYYYATKI